MKKRKRRDIKGIVLSIIAVLGGFTISIINSGFDLKSISNNDSDCRDRAMFIGLRRGIKLQKQAWESFEIKWDSDVITKSQIRTNVVSIQKNEILEIVENKYGAIVKSGNNSNSFYTERIRTV
ncbi:MAG: hypothetical protein R2825_06085 [Saprospiraceae bacterium]